MFKSLWQASEQQIIEQLGSAEPERAFARSHSQMAQLFSALDKVIRELCWNDLPRTTTLSRISKATAAAGPNAKYCQDYLNDRISKHLVELLDAAREQNDPREAPALLRRAEKLLALLVEPDPIISEKALGAIMLVAPLRPAQAVEAARNFRLSDFQIARVAAELISSSSWESFKYLRAEFAPILVRQASQLDLAAMIAVARATELATIEQVLANYQLTKESLEEGLKLAVRNNLRIGESATALRICAKFNLEFNSADPENSAALTDCYFVLIRSGRWQGLVDLKQAWKIKLEPRLWRGELEECADTELSRLLDRADLDGSRRFAALVGLPRDRVVVRVKQAVLNLLSKKQSTEAFRLCQGYGLDSSYFNDRESRAVMKTALLQEDQVFPVTLLPEDFFEDYPVKSDHDHLEKRRLTQLVNLLKELPFDTRRGFLGIKEATDGGSREYAIDVVDRWIANELRLLRMSNEPNFEQHQDRLLQLRALVLEGRWTVQADALLEILGNTKDLSSEVVRREGVASLLARTGHYLSCCSAGQALHSLTEGLDFIERVNRMVLTEQLDKKTEKLERKIISYRDALVGQADLEDIVRTLQQTSHLPHYLISAVPELLALPTVVREERSAWARGMRYLHSYHRLNRWCCDCLNFVNSTGRVDKNSWPLAVQRCEILLRPFGGLLAERLRREVTPHYYYADFPIGYPLSDQLFTQQLELFCRVADPNCIVSQELVEAVDDWRVRLRDYFARQRIEAEASAGVACAIKRASTVLLDFVDEPSIYRRADSEVFEREFNKAKLRAIFEREAQGFNSRCQQLLRLIKEEQIVLSDWGVLALQFEDQWLEWITDRSQNGLTGPAVRGGSYAEMVRRTMPAQYKLFLEDQYFARINQLRGFK